MKELTKTEPLYCLRTSGFFVFILAFLATVLCSNAYSGKVYKWVDENGVVQYGYHPPFQSKSIQELNLKVPAVKNKNGTEGNQAQESIKKQLEVYEDIRREKQEKKRKEKEKKRKLAQECSSLRAELKDLKRGGVVWYSLDRNGNRVYSTNEQIERKIKTLEDAIKYRCR